MRRIQSIELHDQPWFPAPWRDHLTSFLSTTATRFNLYRAIVPLMASLSMRTAQTRQIDLCSGAGGPARWLQRALETEHAIKLTLTVTDKFPNLEAWRAAGLDGHTEPVDVLNVPKRLTGIRTMFASFHHFPPAQAQAILQDAVHAQAPIAIFEGTQRSPLGLLVMMTSWLSFMLLTPTIRPLRPSVLIFTYLIPLLPLIVVWDGLISCMRTYSPDELLAMCADLHDAQHWSFDAGITQGQGPPIVYLIGAPATPPLS